MSNPLAPAGRPHGHSFTDKHWSPDAMTEATDRRPVLMGHLWKSTAAGRDSTGNNVKPQAGANWECECFHVFYAQAFAASIKALSNFSLAWGRDLHMAGLQLPKELRTGALIGGGRRQQHGTSEAPSGPECKLPEPLGLMLKASVGPRHRAGASGTTCVASEHRPADTAPEANTGRHTPATGNTLQRQLVSPDVGRAKRERYGFGDICKALGPRGGGEGSRRRGKVSINRNPRLYTQSTVEKLTLLEGNPQCNTSVLKDPENRDDG
ncbi:hypothetical protein EYF80_011922 [Liparis tanakae]|uniref:Uncharacterized protein n=1 Tax=Liparis tanakae TaxID=230148 RepID=A0A4Z2IJA0_9TELE|nr:hypothetical protein EYF80_011922 [Liparis tanakae]